MVARNGIDYATNTAVFSISKAADLADLPTVTAPGRDYKGTNLEPVAPGSLAYMNDGSGKTYTLDGDTNEWKERLI